MLRWQEIIGLIQKATITKQKNEEKKELELIKLAVSAAQVTGERTITTENLNNELKDIFDNDKEATEISVGWFYQSNSNSYRIYKDGKIEYANILPNEYKQVEYIESTGTQYIDTGLLAKDYSEINVIIDGNYTKLNTDRYIFGCSRGSNYCLVGIAFGSINFVAQNGEAETEKIFQEADLYKHIFSLDFFKKIALCDSNTIVLEYDVNKLINNNYFLFSINRDGRSSSNASFKMNYCTIKNKDDLFIRHYIPCYSTTIVTDVDGIERPKYTAGMYDIVNGSFYVNKGTGTFLKGADV